VAAARSRAAAAHASRVGDGAHPPRRSDRRCRRHRRGRRGATSWRAGPARQLGQLRWHRAPGSAAKACVVAQAVMPLAPGAPQDSGGLPGRVSMRRLHWLPVQSVNEREWQASSRPKMPV